MKEMPKPDPTNDETIYKVLLHAGSTRAYLKRLKERDPKRWRNAYINMLVAFENLKPKQVIITKHLIGVFDPEIDESWPWHCHYEHGQYLSSKKRLCKIGKAAQFDSADEARLFFHHWKSKGTLKMEVIEVKHYEFV